MNKKVKNTAFLATCDLSVSRALKELLSRRVGSIRRTSQPLFNGSIPFMLISRYGVSLI